MRFFLSLSLIFIILFSSCEKRKLISEIDYAWSKTSVNATIFRKNSLVSDSHYQYISYYDSLGQVVLGKRQHGSNKWELHTTGYKGNVWDAHNIISIMVDGDGFLHIAWDHHDGPLNYARSVEPGSLLLGPKTSMIGTLEDNFVSYPEFYALPDGGMYFAYRYGGSGDGNMVLNRYFPEEKKWLRIQDNLISGGGKRNAYWQMAVDNEGYIHVSYVWRDSWDVSTNHNLCYARSVDGGYSWFSSSGSELEVPITYEGSEVILEIPMNSNLINQTSMTTDSNGNPALASYWTAPGDSVTQFFVVYHNGMQWHVSQATERTLPFSLSGGGTRRIPVSRPQLLSLSNNEENRFYLIYRDAEEDNHVVIASANTASQMQWKSWVVGELELGQWEPSFDTELWRHRGILSLFTQKVGQGEGNERYEDMEPQVVKVFQLSSDELNRYIGLN